MNADEKKQKVIALIKDLNDLEEAILLMDDLRFYFSINFIDHDDKKGTHILNVSNKKSIINFIKYRKECLDEEIDKLLNN